MTLTNRRYEERIKALGKELNVARAAVNEAQKRCSPVPAAPKPPWNRFVRNLKRCEPKKSKLLARLAEETSRLKTTALLTIPSSLNCVKGNTVPRSLRVNWKKKSVRFPKALLAKRIEQNQQARNKIRQLLLALKKQRNGSVSGLSDEIDFNEGIGNDSMDQIDVDVEVPNNTVAATVTPANNKSDANQHSDDDEILLQLNEQTEAVLNEEINMMEIDPMSCGEEESVYDHEQTGDNKIISNHTNQIHSRSSELKNPNRLGKFHARLCVIPRSFPGGGRFR